MYKEEEITIEQWNVDLILSELGNTQKSLIVFRGSNGVSLMGRHVDTQCRHSKAILDRAIRITLDDYIVIPDYNRESCIKRCRETLPICLTLGRIPFFVLRSI